MAVVFNVIIPILAGICVLATLYFAVKALTARAKASSKAYDVGRQEARISFQVNLIRSVFALVLALILFGVMGIGLSAEFTPLSPPTPTATATSLATAMPPPQETVTPAIEPTTLSSPTATVPAPTVTPLPTPTSTPEPPTAVVSSEAGVWLRSAPGLETEQIEWLLFETVLFVLDGRQTVDEFDWVQVQTEGGSDGWVAADFITISQP